MKIVRYQTTNGQFAYGQQHSDGRTTRLAGDIFCELTDTSEPADVAKLLAPIEPRDTVTIEIDGIGALTNPIVAEGESA